MAKKLIAVTEIRHDDEVIPAGETLDASKFDKKQLEALYDAGAVRVEDGSGAEPTNAETTSQTTSAEASSPANTTTSSAKAPAAVTKEPTNVKGNAK